MKQQLAEIQRHIRNSAQQTKQLQELQQKVKFIEERLDDGHQLDMARDFTYHELKNICIKV